MMRNQCQNLIIVLAVLIITLGGSYDHRCSRTEAFSTPTTVETRPTTYTKQIIPTSTSTTEPSPPLYQQDSSLFTDLPTTTQQEQQQEISGSSISTTTNYLESLARRTTTSVPGTPQSSHDGFLNIDDETDSITIPTTIRSTTVEQFHDDDDDDDDDDAQCTKQQQTTNGTTSKEALMKQIREAGVAGIISFGLVQLGFWGLSIPIVVGGYYQMTGHWPDWNNVDDIKGLGAESFAFVNIARIAAPFRIAVALGAIPFFQENIVNRFGGNNKKGKEKEDVVESGGGK